MEITHTLFLIVVVALIGYAIYHYHGGSMTGVKEGFETYKRNPYGFYESGASHLNFYEFPTYRKPFMYPQQFYKSYPVPHLSYFEDSVSL
jgi:hypothetical protein